MIKGHFYYLKDQYFVDFPDSYLMQNKETINGQSHDRPCFYAYEDDKSGLFWFIPCSSRVKKYRAIYQKKLNRNNSCDTIVFGEILGKEKAFLIQNACPVLPKYIKNEYLDAVTGIPVRVEKTLEKELSKKFKKVITLQRKGYRLIFPDVLKIEKELLSQSDNN